MSANNGSGSSSRRLSQLRDAWSSALSFLATSPSPPEPAMANGRSVSPPPSQPMSVAAATTTATAATSSTSTTAAAVNPAMMNYISAPSPSAIMNATQIPGTNCYLTPSASAILNNSKVLEVMRSYETYVLNRKPHGRGLILILVALLFFLCCTTRGRYEHTGGAGSDSIVSSVSTPGLGGGGAGSAGGLPGAAGAGAGVSTGKDGSLRTADLDSAIDEAAADNFEARRRRVRLPLLLQWITGWVEETDHLDMSNVEWWPPSNRTVEDADAESERGLKVGTPNAASLSVARSQPPWTASGGRGVFALIGRLIDRVVRLFVTPDPPPYTLALSAFFRTRQAMSEGSCNRCQSRVIEEEVRAERHNYHLFLRHNKLRVPMLLYYNRLPVYALFMHFRLMRVRNYQLLDYVSRPDAALRHPETVANDVSGDSSLHSRELDYELTRLAFVFYLQRLHLRAMRHADAMRLETFHFLRHLSSTVQVLRHLWTGQDYCTWPGVHCIVVKVPLNMLIDDDHPAVQTFVGDLFSICRGHHCEQRRCIHASCAAHTQHLTRRLFTAAAPAYWLMWDRNDDTAAMDEMIFAKPTPKTPTEVEAVAATAAQQQQQQQQSAAQQQQQQQQATAAAGFVTSASNMEFSRSRVGSVLSNTEMSPLRADGGAVVHGSRAGRTTTTRAERTVWTEQQFAYEHPSLLLAQPTLLMDVDVEKIMEDVVWPAIGDPVLSKTPEGTYLGNAERPLIEDLIPMQRRLLHTIAAAAPRGIRVGKQRATADSTLTIPYTFVMLSLANMGLRGYLPDFYDTQSTYDVTEAAAAANTNARSSAAETGGGTAKGSSSSSSKNGNKVDGDNDEEEQGTQKPASDRGRIPGVRVQNPRSDVYWGRLSRHRMLESRNLSSTRVRRALADVHTIASEIQRVLRRVEKIGQRNNHEDLGAYFSEVSTLAQFQNEKWSAYRWPEAMVAVTNAVSQSGWQRLYPVLESNAFSHAFEAAPVRNIDHSVEVFGEINPRLVGLLALDVSGNPLLSHIFPRTWMSIPFLQTVLTYGSSILAPPLRMRARVYNQTFYCPPGSGLDEVSPYIDDARRSRQRVMADATRDKTVIASSIATGEPGGSAVVQTSMHDRDYIGSVLVPPFSKIDSVFAEGEAEAVSALAVAGSPTDSLATQKLLHQRFEVDFADGLLKGLWRTVIEYNG